MVNHVIIEQKTIIKVYIMYTYDKNTENVEGIGDEKQKNRNTNDSVLNTHSNREITLLEIIF